MTKRKIQNKSKVKITNARTLVLMFDICHLG